MPSQKRFHAADPAVAQFELGLVLQAELARGQRMAQRPLESDPAHRMLVAARGCQADLPRAGLRGRSQRVQRGRQQRTGQGTVVGRAGRADGTGREDACRTDREGLRERALDRAGACRDDRAEVDVRLVADEDGEFAPGEPGQRVAIGQRRDQPRREGHRECVRGLVSQPLLDLGQLRNLDGEERHPSMRGAFGCQPGLRRFDQAGAVGQARHRVAA